MVLFGENVCLFPHSLENQGAQNRYEIADDMHKLAWYSSLMKASLYFNVTFINKRSSVTLYLPHPHTPSTHKREKTKKVRLLWTLKLVKVKDSLLLKNIA